MANLLIAERTGRPEGANDHTQNRNNIASSAVRVSPIVVGLEALVNALLGPVPV